MTRGTPFLAAIAAVVLALAGCSSGGTQRITLAETKSPAQLLRNEIASRIPAEMIASVDRQDLSESCDADGLVRSWRSTALVSIAPVAAAGLESTTSDLVDSFVDQGWKSSTRDASSRLLEYRLTSTTSSADVHITADAGEDDGTGATLLVAVNGPCVVTEGPDSKEVTELENQDG